ncbi:MAG: hypothetical protein CMF46_00780 [Legionellales bacterium]|nr:hypothetical protein [Legionellales bacterium]
MEDNKTHYNQWILDTILIKLLGQRVDSYAYRLLSPWIKKAGHVHWLTVVATTILILVLLIITVILAPIRMIIWLLNSRLLEKPFDMTFHYLQLLFEKYDSDRVQLLPLIITSVFFIVTLTIALLFSPLKGIGWALAKLVSTSYRTWRLNSKINQHKLK